MEKRIITISREFGSAGRTIGHAVADKLGIPFPFAHIPEPTKERMQLLEQALGLNA